VAIDVDAMKTQARELLATAARRLPGAHTDAAPDVTEDASRALD
jgi:hypothetical protein